MDLVPLCVPVGEEVPSGLQTVQRQPLFWGLQRLRLHRGFEVICLPCHRTMCGDTSLKFAVEMFLSDCWRDPQHLGASEIPTTAERLTRVRNPRDTSVTSSGKQEPHGALRGLWSGAVPQLDKGFCYKSHWFLFTLIEKNTGLVSQAEVATLLWQPLEEGLGHVVQALHLPIHPYVSLISSGFDVSPGCRPDKEQNSTFVWHNVGSGRHFFLLSFLAGTLVSF